jgi:tripartite-type tricarboxylate transporter receptor subunit TctC
MIDRLVAVVLSLLALLAGPSYAQDYPNRPIRVVVGPGPDIVARVFGAKMGELLGQPIVVEPRPGAGGVIAAQTVAAAAPDGYTLLQVTASYTINTALQSSPLDLRKDFAPVGHVSTIPFVLVLHPSVPAKSLAELIAYAKANPGKLNYASSGIGTPPHLAGELFKSMAAVDIVHVPFREANSGLSAVLDRFDGAVADRWRHRTRNRRDVARAFAAGAEAARARAIRPRRFRGDRLERLRRAEGYASAGRR